MKGIKPNRISAPCITEKVKNQSVWSTLNDEEVELFNRKVVCRRYSAGEIIFFHGDRCKGLYFVDGGLVAVRKTDVDGQSVLVRLAKGGDTIGYLR